MLYIHVIYLFFFFLLKFCDTLCFWPTLKYGLQKKKVHIGGRGDGRITTILHVILKNVDRQPSRYRCISALCHNKTKSVQM